MEFTYFKHSSIFVYSLVVPASVLLWSQGYFERGGLPTQKDRGWHLHLVWCILFFLSEHTGFDSLFFFPIWALPVIVPVTMGETFNVCEPQILHFYTGDILWCSLCIETEMRWEVYNFIFRIVGILIHHSNWMLYSVKNVGIQTKGSELRLIRWES